MDETLKNPRPEQPRPDERKVEVSEQDEYGAIPSPSLVKKLNEEAALRMKQGNWKTVGGIPQKNRAEDIPDKPSE